MQYHDHCAIASYATARRPVQTRSAGLTCQASKAAQEGSVVLRGGGHQGQQQLQQQLALQIQRLVTHHYIQHLLKVLAVYLQLAVIKI